MQVHTYTYDSELRRALFEGSLAVLIVKATSQDGCGLCHMPCAISLYLCVDLYKLLPSRFRGIEAPSITGVIAGVSESASLSLYRLNYCVRGRRIIGTRHAPCPKYGAQMTTTDE